jgi:DNA replication and repair protein RecF
MNFIKTLRLQNFRKYVDKEFTFDSPITVIHAPNAMGKTTILEAISVIANGNSGWTSSNSDIYCYDAAGISKGMKNTSEVTRNIKDEKSMNYRVSAGINNKDDDLKEFSLFQSPTQKKFLIDHHSTTARKFSGNMAATIFSPEHIELLMISPQQRRNYIDQNIAKIDLDFADHLKVFKKISRQRNAFIKKLSKRFYETGVIPKVDTDQQFLYWSTEFAKVSTQIIIKRIEFIEKLVSEDFRIEYVSSLNLNEFEMMLDYDKLYEKHVEMLVEGAKRDIATGHTHIGAHRDDWSIITSLEVKRFGSRGEKRMAIGKLIFLVQDVLAGELGFYPFLLLDDISSELDQENIKKILSDDIMDKQQVFVTTVSLEGFDKELDVLVV